MNFLIKQYNRDNALPINHNYLKEQFAGSEEILADVARLVEQGDFTLGAAVDAFEAEFAIRQDVKHAIGVGSGTDAIFLSLKALGIGEGDEVITTPFTFYATIGAIVTAGAKPIFVDISDDMNIDPQLIKEKITNKTKAIVPVHWSGKPCDMQALQEIAKQHDLKIVEDACHAILAELHQKKMGYYCDAAAFSMHPLKNLNVWGDGGVICTNDDFLADKLRLIRNHGLQGRDTCIEFAYNSRLDTLQAIVASHLIKRIDHITDARIRNSRYLDSKLRLINRLKIPRRDEHNTKQVFHIYSILAEQRDELQKHLLHKGIDAKVHYPTPMHLQPAAKYLGYKPGDFPEAEKIASSTISLPVHEYISTEDLDKVVFEIEAFYG